jgi:hypothetical protein
MAQHGTLPSGMTNNAPSFGTPDSVALHLHSSEIVSGKTREIVVRNSNASIERIHTDAVVQHLHTLLTPPTHVQLPSPNNPNVLLITYKD